MMEYQVIESLRAKVSGEERLIPSGIFVTLSVAQADRLVAAGKVIPIRPSITEVPIPDQPPKPYLDAEGDPVIPSRSDPKYHYWAEGQSLDATMKELWEERAAIREYEGGLSREQAEWEARKDIEGMGQGFELFK